MLLVRRVVGESMLPALRPGQIVVGWRRGWQIKSNSVVIIQHDGVEKIKRVVRVEQNQLFVLGDNLAASTDSRHFGWLSRSAVIGRIIWPRRISERR